MLPEVGRGFATFNREPAGPTSSAAPRPSLPSSPLVQPGPKSTASRSSSETSAERAAGVPATLVAQGRARRRHAAVPAQRRAGATNINDPSYDHALTRELVQLAMRKFPQVTILFNDPLLVRDGLTRRFAGHDNHLHLRFT